MRRFCQDGGNSGDDEYAIALGALMIAQSIPGSFSTERDVMSNTACIAEVAKGAYALEITTSTETRSGELRRSLRSTGTHR
jgi:hypothetical protein